MNLRWILQKEAVRMCEVDLPGSGQGPMAGFGISIFEPSGSITTDQSSLTGYTTEHY
jgi:hypothetical protein